MYLCTLLLSRVQGTPAETLLYQVKVDGYVWVSCRVKEWDQAARMFLVEFDAASGALLLVLVLESVQACVRVQGMCVCARVFV